MIGISLVVSSIIFFQYKINTSFFQRLFPYEYFDFQLCFYSLRHCISYRIMFLTYYILCDFIIFISILFIDIKLFRKLKEQNRSRLNVIKSAKVIEENSKSEKRLTKWIIFNTLLTIVIKLPNLLGTYFNLKLTINNEPSCAVVNCFILNNIGDFLFSLSGLFQFHLFYLFNNNFRKKLRAYLNQS